ncbi:cholecystokinin receptor-like protein [Leptotrombidium deliense]|uniref:Cholecystokinin receptor-like protein n=1 Tax=Leptotrombidium deliense TaxID=299467 RepID=A0A443SFL0_9ACAR|nr:cholecystokinin receptor-like protein [Leptotrombidium deliense]
MEHYNSSSSEVVGEYTTNGVEQRNASETVPTLKDDESLLNKENIVTMVLPYTCIFILAVVGNMLVIVTLAVNRRMRSVTNSFLINLAVSDLLLGVFCMPFSLIGLLMKQFIFGSIMCRLVPYLQAVSVCVSSWTLVVVSVERYYAICHPLKSRGYRQSWGHVYKLIAAIWIFSSVIMSPIALLSELQPLKEKSEQFLSRTHFIFCDSNDHILADKFKCRESWPSEKHLIAFTIFLDVILFVIPLIVMIVTYSQIVVTLWRNISDNNCMTKAHEEKKNHILTFADKKVESKAVRNEANRSSRIIRGLKLRSSVDQRLVQQRQSRVIRMLFVVVIEFFICWTPLHFINTVSLFYPRAVYRGLGYTWISIFQLLAFFSCCTNPITYCFMNSKFRQSFLLLFKCSTNESHRNLDKQTYPPDDLSHSYVNSSPNYVIKNELSHV